MTSTLGGTLSKVTVTAPFNTPVTVPRNLAGSVLEKSWSPRWSHGHIDSPCARASMAVPSSATATARAICVFLS